MRIAMLGPLEVRADDGTPVEVTGARLRALLILLALTPGRVVTTDRLIDGVWGSHPPAEAVNALQALVSRLRRALPEPCLESSPTGYRLAVPPEAVDIHRFETLAAAGRAALAGRLNGERGGAAGPGESPSGGWAGSAGGGPSGVGPTFGTGGSVDGGRGWSAAGGSAGKAAAGGGGRARSVGGGSADNGSVGGAVGVLREALGLWRGEALADVATAAFAQASRARLGELRLQALGDRIEADLVPAPVGSLPSWRRSLPNTLCTNGSPGS